MPSGERPVARHPSGRRSTTPWPPRRWPRRGPRGPPRETLPAGTTGGRRARTAARRRLRWRFGGQPLQGLEDICEIERRREQQRDAEEPHRPSARWIHEEDDPGPPDREQQGAHDPEARDGPGHGRRVRRVAGDAPDADRVEAPIVEESRLLGGGLDHARRAELHRPQAAGGVEAAQESERAEARLRTNRRAASRAKRDARSRDTCTRSDVVTARCLTRR